MVTVSYDPDARTLYWYFAELIAEAIADEGECDGTLLLDADGQIIGLEIELDESITPTDLTLALSHPGVRYDAAQFTLIVQLIDEEPAAVQPLEETVIIDFDAAGSVLGCEIAASEEFEIAERFARLGPFMVSLDEDATAPAAGKQPDTPVVEEHLPRPAQPAPIPETPADFRSGFVALVGRPNVGKSTLLNALLDRKVAIVSPRPQTTRSAMRGILTRPDAQIIFVDTPGIHTPKTRLGSYMVEQARQAIPDADIVGFLVDISEPPGKLDLEIAAMIRRARGTKLLILNKVDIKNPHGAENHAAYRALGDWDMEIAVSALRRRGLETLVDEIIRRLPIGPGHYPADQVSDQTERQHAAELVREQVLRATEQEVPHGVAVEVEEWEPRDTALYIRMTIYVEKESQKGILIGAGGAMLKKIGSAARQTIEHALGKQIYLDLWVKARPNWRDDPSSLHWLGYTR